MGGIKYYQLAKGEELPDEFCAVRDIGGEPSEYTFYAPEAENAKLRTQLADVTESMGRVEQRCAKLRELVRDYINAPCTTCDCWQDDFRCWNYDGADCGLVARARELGVEVDG